MEPDSSSEKGPKFLKWKYIVIIQVYNSDQKLNKLYSSDIFWLTSLV